MAFQAADGTQLGRHLAKNVGRKWRGGGCDGLPSLEISLESMESHAVPHSILTNHTEGHRLNRRDTLSRKAGLRLGKDSAGVGVKNLLGQSSLKYCRRQGLNRCPLAWELGTLPLDQLDLVLKHLVVVCPRMLKILTYIHQRKGQIILLRSDPSLRVSKPNKQTQLIIHISLNTNFESCAITLN